MGACACAGVAAHSAGVYKEKPAHRAALARQVNIDKALGFMKYMRGSLEIKLRDRTQGCAGCHVKKCLGVAAFIDALQSAGCFIYTLFSEHRIQAGK